MFCLLLVVAKLSVIAKRLAKRTPLRNPFRGKEIISTKPRPKSVFDFFGSVYWFIVYCVFILSLSLHDICHTSMARYSMFGLKCR